MRPKPSTPTLKTTGFAAALIAGYFFAEQAGSASADILGNADLSSVSDTWGAYDTYTTVGATAHPEYGVGMDNATLTALGPATIGGIGLDPTQDQFTIVVHARIDGDGTLFAKTDEPTSSNRMLQLFVGGGGLQLRLGGSQTTISNSTFSSGDEVVVAFSSAPSAGGGNGQTRVSVNGATAGTGSAIIPSSAVVDETDEPIRIGARGDGAGGEAFFGDGVVFSVQIFSQAYTGSNLSSLAEAPYQTVEDRVQSRQSLGKAGTAILARNSHTAKIGDSQFSPTLYRLSSYYDLTVSPENITGRFASLGENASTTGVGTTHYSTTNLSVDPNNTPASGGIPTLIANAGRAASRTSIFAGTGDIADTFEMVTQYLWNIESSWGGDLWFGENPMAVRILSIRDTGQTIMPGVQARTRRGSNTSTLAPLSLSGTQTRMYSDDLTVVTNSPSERLQVEVLTGSSSEDETGTDFNLAGMLFYKGSAGTLPATGYISDTMAEAGWSTEDWATEVSWLGFADHWAHIGLPRTVFVMLGHNQETGETSQLDAGNLTGDFTDNTNTLLDNILDGIRVARAEHGMLTEDVEVVLITPWRPSESSPSADETNIRTIHAVHAAIAEERGIRHASIAAEQNFISPWVGLHPNDYGTDEEKDQKTTEVLNALEAQLTGWTVSTGGGANRGRGRSRARSSPV